MSLRRRLLRFACAAGAVALLTVGGASAERDRNSDASCTWGASSVTAQTVDSRMVESQPATSGCVTP
jgi:hypothetical protein